MVDLREERDTFEALFQSKAEECAELSKTNTHLKELVCTSMEKGMFLIEAHHLFYSWVSRGVQLGAVCVRRRRRWVQGTCCDLAHPVRTGLCGHL